MSRILSFESIPAEMFERESSDGSTEPWGDYLSQSSYKETMISSQVLRFHSHLNKIKEHYCSEDQLEVHSFSEERSEHLEDFVSVASFQSESEDVYGTPPRSLTFGGFIKQKPIMSMWSYDSIPGKIFSSQPIISAHNDASTNSHFYRYSKPTSNNGSQSTLASGRTISAELIPRADTFSAFEEPSAITYKLSFGSIPKENMKPNFVSRSPLFAHNRRNRLRIQKQLSVSDDIITEEPQPETARDESDQQPQDPGPKVPIVWSNCICCVTVEIMCRIYETCLAICNR